MNSHTSTYEYKSDTINFTYRDGNICNLNLKDIVFPVDILTISPSVYIEPSYAVPGRHAFLAMDPNITHSNNNSLSFDTMMFHHPATGSPISMPISCQIQFYDDHMTINIGFKEKPIDNLRYGLFFPIADSDQVFFNGQYGTYITTHYLSTWERKWFHQSYISQPNISICNDTSHVDIRCSHDTNVQFAARKYKSISYINISTTSISSDYLEMELSYSNIKQHSTQIIANNLIVTTNQSKKSNGIPKQLRFDKMEDCEIASSLNILYSILIEHSIDDANIREIVLAKNIIMGQKNIDGFTAGDSIIVDATGNLKGTLCREINNKIQWERYSKEPESWNLEPLIAFLDRITLNFHSITNIYIQTKDVLDGVLYDQLYQIELYSYLNSESHQSSDLCFINMKLNSLQESERLLSICSKHCKYLCTTADLDSYYFMDKLSQYFNIIIADSHKKSHNSINIFASSIFQRNNNEHIKI